MPVTISGLGGVTFPDATNQSTASSTTAIGVGQTWQNVTSSRNFGTTYTNSTGKPIQIVVSFTGIGTASLTIDGVLISQFSADTGFVSVITAIIPNNSNYVVANVNGTTTKNNWSELR